MICDLDCLVTLVTLCELVPRLLAGPYVWPGPRRMWAKVTMWTGSSCLTDTLTIEDNPFTRLCHVIGAVWCIPDHRVWSGLCCNPDHEVWPMLCSGPDIKLFILVGLGRSFFVCCLAQRGSTVGFLLLQCSSGVVRHLGDLRVSVATRSCRVLIFASS